MKKDLPIAVAVILAVAVAAFGIDRIVPDPPLSPSRPYTAKPAHTTAAAGKVIMHVNGEPVTEQEFNAFVQQQVPQEMQEYFLTNPEGRARAADEMVKFIALAQEGRRLGAESDPQALAAINWTAKSAYAQYALQKMAPKPDEGLVQREYETLRANPTTAEWSHIMIAYQGGQAPPRKQPALTLDQARAKAQSLADNIRAGAVFADVARAESDDTNSAANGGRLPGVTAQNLPPEVRALKMGEVSTPIQTPFGIHLFRLAMPPLAEVRPQIEQKLQGDRMAAEAERLKNQAKVERDPEFFKTAPAAAQ